MGRVCAVNPFKIFSPLRGTLGFPHRFVGYWAFPPRRGGCHGKEKKVCVFKAPQPASSTPMRKPAYWR